ncbi:hypothetical protein [Flavobacterium piscis]|uniref:Uncharacterized protein n=1 Tax=Flavobacterium piscis TaxID=1114874 RepID=A0ABU1Y7S0_9FLAO|nr:hypothetical protein [Flavobacterium piscis]MDR7209536.1 hypothetical protein [Flavobacterium piscis]
MTALEVGNLDGLVTILVLIMVGPPFLFSIIGFSVRKNHPKTAKVLFILSAVYLLVGLGICGSLMA